MPKTTAKDFKIFKEECQKWLDEFGLKGWESDFKHDKKADEWLAQLSTNTLGRTCTFTLAGAWGPIENNQYEVKKCGFHEVMELFIQRIRYLALSREVRQDEIIEECHHIIRTLENVIFDKIEED